MRILAFLRRWWRHNLVESVDQLDAIARVKDECDLGGRYIFMTSMSAGIAVLGLILSSPAVVIGAMLLSPLMGPIIGAGFALAIWDVKWMREAGRTLFIGAVASILLAALISWMSPIQTITPEIASRTNPSLLDLAVALFSGLAGSYAMIRGRAGTIVGVAIAVALMPPLAVVGFGLATWNWTVFGGALMLFITNLVTIAATSAFIARLYGFRSSLSKKRGWVQSSIIIAALVILAVPLTLSLRNIAFQATSERTIQTVVKNQFDTRARLDQLDVDWDSSPLSVTATVLTPGLVEGAEANAQQRLADLLGEPAIVEIVQIDIGNRAAEQAALTAARNRAAAEDMQRQVDTITDKLALIAGVAPTDIVIDREKRRARVAAQPLDGASLDAYRRLEGRLLDQAPGWRIELVPPLRALPDVAIIDDDGPDLDAIAIIAWAAQRRELPVRLAGEESAVFNVRSLLLERGLRAIETQVADGDPAVVRTDWAVELSD